MDYYDDWKPYVPVAARRRLAARELAKLAKKGHPASPVVIDGVRQPRAPQRLREPAAALPDLRPERFGGGDDDEDDRKY